MVKRKQRRVLRYVEEGSLMKLKSFLRKHKDLELNFTQGKKHRSPLHIACSHGDDAVLRLLLKHGADPLQTDRNGDTPLHLAAKRALKHGKRAYDDLVVPLRKNCPEAVDMSNKAGVTPDDLLQWMKPEQGKVINESCVDPEQQWREKLLGECQDEFFETFGQYDDRGRSFGDHGADRIRREYYCQATAKATCSGKPFFGPGRGQKAAEGTGRKDEGVRRELETSLEAESIEEVPCSGALAKEDEKRLGRARRAHMRSGCAATFHSSSSKAPEELLGYDDIPWPAPRGSLEEMVGVMLHGADRFDSTVFRKLLRRQQALWHPDKFVQRCGGRLLESDRQKILDTVTGLSQELNRLAQTLR
ncbi:hypothetical protein cypCar_00031367 [Cyprinus carpio]|nr:hypothetical protein cypCar_00031367 [Cyprinus carpio]